MAAGRPRVIQAKVDQRADDELLKQIHEEYRTRLRRIEVKRAPDAWDEGLWVIEVTEANTTQQLKLNAREMVELGWKMDRVLATQEEQK